MTTTFDSVKEESLPSEFYSSEEIFQNELERIFYSNWIMVCHQSELQNFGDSRVVNVGSKSAIVVNSGSGKFRAFYNVCRHRGSSILEGRTTLKVFQCPYHGWTYNLDGRLVGAPLMERTLDFQKEDYSLFDVRLETWGGFIWINLSNERPASLQTFLGDFGTKFDRYSTESLRWVGSVGVYDAHANWKAVVENANECYHCPLIHPETIGPYYLQHLPFDSSEIDGPYTILYWDNASEAAPESYRSKDDGGDFFKHLTTDDLRRMYIAQVFPNAQFFFSPDRLYTFQVWPLDSRKSLITCDMYFQAFNHSDPTESMTWVDFINRQDLKLLELHQKGLDSKVFRGGRFSYLEKPVQEFQKLYKKFYGLS